MGQEKETAICVVLVWKASGVFSIGLFWLGNFIGPVGNKILTLQIFPESGREIPQHFLILGVKAISLLPRMGGDREEIEGKGFQNKMRAVVHHRDPSVLLGGRKIQRTHAARIMARQRNCPMDRYPRNSPM